MKKKLKTLSKGYKQAVAKNRIKRTGYFKTWENIYFSPVALQAYLKDVKSVKGNKKNLTNMLVLLHDNETDLTHTRYAKEEKYNFIHNRQLSLFGYTAMQQETLVEKLDISLSTVKRTTKELASKDIIFKRQVHKMYCYAVIDKGTRLLMLHSRYLDIILDMINNIGAPNDWERIENILQVEYNSILQLIEMYASYKYCTLKKACVSVLDALNLYMEQIEAYQSGDIDTHEFRGEDIKRAIIEYYDLDQ